MTRRLVLLALVAVAVVVAGGSTRMSSAAFTATTTVPGNTITADRVSNYFQVTPGSAVRPGTSTPVASGDVDTLTLDFGTVPPPAPTPTSSPFRTSPASPDGHPHEPRLHPDRSRGLRLVRLLERDPRARASTTVSVTSSSTALGLGTGTVRLGVSGSPGSTELRDRARAAPRLPPLRPPPRDRPGGSTWPGRPPPLWGSGLRRLPRFRAGYTKLKSPRWSARRTRTPPRRTAPPTPTACAQSGRPPEPRQRHRRRHR